MTDTLRSAHLFTLTLSVVFGEMLDFSKTENGGRRIEARSGTPG